MKYTIYRGSEVVVADVEIQGSVTEKIMGEETASLTFSAYEKIEFHIGDKITIFGRDYFLQDDPINEKVNSRLYNYTLTFYSLKYSLSDTFLFFHDENNELTIPDFDLMGNASTCLDLIISNLNADPLNDGWTKGTVDDTEVKLISFASINCLEAISKLAEEFELEYWIDSDKSIHFTERKPVSGYSFAYGQAQGLRNIKRSILDGGSLCTRLYVKGGTQNLPKNYRSGQKNLRIDVPYLEKNVNIYGRKSHIETFEDIYPKYEGEVTAVSTTDPNIFTDANLPFDLNAYNEYGTTILKAGVTAKIIFQTGQLAGYTIELLEAGGFNSATKTFYLNRVKDEADIVVPSELLRPAVGDKYIIVDIMMPETYVLAAESLLKTKAQEYLDKNSRERFQYAVVSDPFYFEAQNVNIPLGSTVHFIDSDFALDDDLRVIGKRTNVQDRYSVELELSEETQVSSIVKSYYEQQKRQNTIINNLKYNAELARRNYLFGREFHDKVFDGEDYFKAENIKPLSIETKMLSLGSRMQQFGLPGVSFKIENNNALINTSGKIVHQTINPDAVREWNIAANSVTGISDNFNYIFIKCQRVGTNASFVVSETPIKVEADADFYHFEVGYLSSIIDGYRKIKTTYGFAQLNPAELSIGRIADPSGNNFIELKEDGIDISAKVIFKSGSSGYENLTDKPDLSSFEQTRDYVNSTLQTDLADLKNRADGVIESWFYSHTPSLSNLPASNWVTTEERNAHIGDTFTNMQEFVDNVTTPDAGKAWRFVKNETTGEFSWSLIANSDSTKALIEAGKAKDTADAKRRVFVSQPYPPYNVGDLWVQGNGGDIMRCKFERLSGSYVATDFEKASKYTDDTAVNNLQIGARNLLLNSKQPIFGLYDQTIGGVLKLYKSQYPTLESDLTYIRVTGGTSSYANLRAVLSLGIPKANEVVSVSFKIKNFLNPITLHSNQGGRETTINVNNKTTLVKWEGIVGDGFGEVQIQIRSLSTDLEMYVWDVMYEKGNKATDWTPAPEDIDSAISTAQNSANTANNLLAEIANDNILTPSEKQSTKKEWDIIVGEKSVVESQANTLGVPTTSYINAYDSLSLYITPLLADLTVNSAIIGSDFRATFKNYYDAKIALLKAVTDKLKSNVDNIQIGGRNLVKQSNKFNAGVANYGITTSVTAEGYLQVISTSWNGNWHTGWSVSNTGIEEQFNEGDLFTITFWVKRVSGNGIPLGYIKEGIGYFSLSGDLNSTDFKPVSYTGVWKKANYINPHLGWESTNGTFQISKWKIEKGNKATDWTPAPEDVVAEYTALVNQEIAEVKGEIAGLETTVNGAFKDGIIEEAEARAIEKYINTLNAEKSDIDNQYNIIYNDALLVDPAKQNLFNQKSSYDTAHSQLITSINTAIADGKTTTAEKADVDSKFTNYKNVLGGLSIRLTEALKAIEAKRVDNLQIGGRNLFRMGMLGKILGGVWSARTDNLNIEGNKITVVSNPIDVFATTFNVKGREITISGRTNIPIMRAFINPYNSAGVKGAERTVTTQRDGENFLLTYTLPVDTVRVDLGLGFYPFSTYGTYWVDNVKVEQGNKATDWTPAPEDVDAKISAEAQKVIDLENKTNFLTGTTIEGNAIATGTLLVGNSDGTNAGITGLGSSSDGVYLWGGGTYQQMVQGLAKKEQRRNGIDIWRHPNGQIGFEIGIKDGRLIFNGYHESGFKLFELDPNRGLIAVSYTQESWTETPFRKLSYSSSTFNESTIASEIQGFLIKESQMNYVTPPPYSPDSEFVYVTTYSVTQNAVGYDYDNGTNPANSSYESLKGMKANYNDRYTNIANGWYMSDIGEIHMESEWNSYPPMTYTFTVYVYYYQDGKITQTKVVTIIK